MITSKTETFYSINEGMPNVSHIPSGKTIYDSLWDYHSLDRLENLISLEIGNIKSCLNKYDRTYEPEHKSMCEELKVYLSYLNESLTKIEKIK